MLINKERKTKTKLKGEVKVLSWANYERLTVLSKYFSTAYNHNWQNIYDLFVGVQTNDGEGLLYAWIIVYIIKPKIWNVPSINIH